MTDNIETGTRLPDPPGFPVEWDSPDEPLRLWEWDNVHSPLPATPMRTSATARIMADGPARASRDLKRTGRSLSKRINGYSYSAGVPDETSEYDREQQRVALNDAIANTKRRWDREFLPKLEADLAYMSGVDLKGATFKELLSWLNEFVELSGYHWYVHFLVVAPLHEAVNKLVELYHEAFGDGSETDAYTLIQGLPNKNIETNRELEVLAGEARDNSFVSRIFADVVGADEILSQLRSAKEAKSFVADLDEYLRVYGLKPTGFDYLFPTWIEDPTFVILNIKSYLQGSFPDVMASSAGKAAQANVAMAKALDQISDEDLKARFTLALGHARDLWPLKEDHAFYIDQGSTACVRRLIAEVGRRLMDNEILQTATDVFYVDWEEMVDALKDRPRRDLMQQVRDRKELRQRQLRMNPPPKLGTLPSISETDRTHDPARTSEPDPTVKVLRGVGCSPGSATGPARVVKSPDEFAKIKPGDVLVCTSTNPTWTPLFGTVAAIVTDSGGMLSHTAIVAREYGLPAVVGTIYGTHLVTDGQLITVDGDAGTVFLA